MLPTPTTVMALPKRIRVRGRRKPGTHKRRPGRHAEDMSRLARRNFRNRSLTSLLWTTYAEGTQPCAEVLFAAKCTLRDQLASVLSTASLAGSLLNIDLVSLVFRLFMVGSTASFTGSATADLDLTLAVFHPLTGMVDGRYEDRQNALACLHQIAKVLRQNWALVSSVELLASARVPILKFYLRSASSGLQMDPESAESVLPPYIEVNLSVHRLESLRNSIFISSLCSLDSRLRPLIYIAKLWAKKAGINNAYNQSLSSYSLSLMALFSTMNCISPPLLTADVVKVRLAKANQLVNSCCFLACPEVLTDSCLDQMYLSSYRRFSLPALSNAFAVESNFPEDLDDDYEYDDDQQSSDEEFDVEDDGDNEDEYEEENEEFNDGSHQVTYSLGRLFDNFICAFSIRRRLEGKLLSVRTGRAHTVDPGNPSTVKTMGLSTGGNGNGNGSGGGSSFFFIEEPFTGMNTAYSVHSRAMYEYILKAFDDARQLIYFQCFRKDHLV